ncbi:hypothetical protein ACHAWF_018300, partial [Thalassiosira exigua]
GLRTGTGGGGGYGVAVGVGTATAAAATTTSLSSASPFVGGDQDFGVLVWDVEAQHSATSGGTKAGTVGKGVAGVAVKTPAYRFAHNTGVESLSWLSGGQILAVGCQRRNVQLYDLRVSGANSPPISMFAHTETVSGIVPDDNCPTGTVFATFGRNAGEPVKIWDARMTDATLGVIAPQYSPACGVGAIAWSPVRHGVLSIVVGDSVRDYDTRSPGSRALPVGVSYVDADDGGAGVFAVRCLAFQPQVFRDREVAPSLTSSAEPAASNPSGANPFALYPHRRLVVSSQGQVKVIPETYAAPLAISRLDGRIATGLGGTVWIGPTTTGPSAMGGQSIAAEDVSARMMRRARCLHESRYSTNAGDNVRVLEEEMESILSQEHIRLRSQHQTSLSEDFKDMIFNSEQLIRCWRWIALVEHLSIERGGTDDGAHNPDDPPWPAKGLNDAGVMKLLRMSSRDVADVSNNWMETKSTSDTLFCQVYDSPFRRYALNACGWIKKGVAVQSLLDECTSRGEFERSAALAVWHGDLNSCVAALQRGAEDTRAIMVSGTEEHTGVISQSASECESYAETLGLIAMCVAGFNVTSASDGTKKTTTLWSTACRNLLQRPEIAVTDTPSQLQLPGVPYLRAILLFLQHIGNSEFDKTIYNEGLSLCDRVAFACRFLSRAKLHSFLDASMRKCVKLGQLEGLLITGLDKRGIALLMNYVDRNSDCQTAGENIPALLCQSFFICLPL